MAALTSEQQALMLAVGVAAVLAAASLVGFALKIAVAKGRPHGAIDNLNTRVNAWWVMCALLGAALVAGNTGVVALFAFASWIALREFTTAGLHGRRDAAVWIRGFALCVVCIAHAPALLFLDIGGYEGRNAFLLLYLLVVVQSCDVFQYVWGKLAGRHRIAPRISPSKSVEGFVGGIASASALGVLLAPITPFTAVQAAGLSCLLALLGFAGGLMMSSAKRERGIKDWGTLVKGHGGVLDRLDSLIFSAPFFFYGVYCWT